MVDPNAQNGEPENPDSANVKGRASELDVFLGKQLRAARLTKNMSQEKLADQLGITFQQIQKYERGKNRISAARLFELSKIFNVPVTYFYDSLEKKGKPAFGFSEQEQEEFAVDDKLESKETYDLIRVYYSIQDPKLRKNLFSFMKSMAENLKSQEKDT